MVEGLAGSRGLRKQNRTPTSCHCQDHISGTKLFYKGPPNVQILANYQKGPGSYIVYTCAPT